MSNNTWINGIQDYFTIVPKKINDYKYVIEDTISVIGKFGIAIDTYDKVNKQPFEFGVYQIELFVDNEIFYSIKFDEYNFGQDNLINEEIDFKLLKENKRFHRLFINNKHKLNFIIKNHPFLLLDNSYHNIIINISDINDNKIQLQGIISGKMLSNNNLFEFIKQDSSIINFKNNNITFNIKSRYENQNQDIKNPLLLNSNQIDLKQLTPPFDVLEFYASDNSGISTRKKYLSLTQLDAYEIKGEISMEHLDAGIIIRFKENIFSGHNPALELYTKNKKKKVMELYRTNKNILSSNIINIKDFHDVEKIKIIYNSIPNLVFEKVLNGFNTNDDKNFFYKKINVDFDSNSFTNPTYVWFEDNIINIDEYEIIVEPFIINPSTIPFKNGINISTIYQECNNCSFYKFNNMKNNWNLINSDNNNKISTNIKYSGTYAVLKENKIPEISNLNPSFNSKYSVEDITTISFKVIDKLSGIDPFKINIWLNNNKMFYDYYPYRDLVISKIIQKLKPGTQELKIEVYDKLGNKKTLNGEFVILEK